MARRVRVALDASLIGAAIAALYWYFLLGPIVVRSQAPVTARVLEAAYPAADLVLMLSLLSLPLLFAQMGRVAWRPLMLLAVAIAALIAIDGFREYGIMHGVVAAGPTGLDSVRILLYGLVGMALALQWRSGDSQQAARPLSIDGDARTQRLDTPRVSRYLAPYTALPAVVALMVYAARTGGSAPTAVGVYVAGALLIELVFLHQFLDYRDLIAYANRTARLESLAATDPVTGLPNHRTIVSILDAELARARRYRHPCTLLFIDLDHFKALNDSFGHPAGDAALREFASVVRTGLRGIDVLGRWGGEEFVALLPETDSMEAMQVAERIRAAVAAHTFGAASAAHITCSIGVATCPDDAGSRHELVQMADGAMYVAKRLGRNQVRPAGDPVVAILHNDAGDAGGGQRGREEAAVLGTVEALAGLLEARDHIGGRMTGGYPHDAVTLATKLALEVGLDTSEAHLVGLAARLYDLGRIGIPDAILNKPGHLTEDEWAVVLAHPAAGAAIVSRIPALQMLAPWVRGHHEQWDGNGYPDGLAGEAIPLPARILAVADAYEAMTHDRTYRSRKSGIGTLAELERCAGSQFDPAIVTALRRVLARDTAYGAA